MDVPRLLFAAAGEKFEDTKGQLPILEVDGSERINSGDAISKYLAKQFNLYGQNSDEAALIDQQMDLCTDLMKQLMPPPALLDRSAGRDRARLEMARHIKVFCTQTVHKQLRELEKLMEKMGRNGFAVGQTLSVADLVIFFVVDFLSQMFAKIEPMKHVNVLEKNPQILTWRKTISELLLLRIKAYPERSANPPAPSRHEENDIGNPDDESSP